MDLSRQLRRTGPIVRRGPIAPGGTLAGAAGLQQAHRVRDPESRACPPVWPGAGGFAASADRAFAADRTDAAGLGSGIAALSRPVRPLDCLHLAPKLRSGAVGG